MFKNPRNTTIFLIFFGLLIAGALLFLGDSESLLGNRNNAILSGSSKSYCEDLVSGYCSNTVPYKCTDCEKQTSGDNAGRYVAVCLRSGQTSTQYDKAPSLHVYSQKLPYDKIDDVCEGSGYVEHSYKKCYGGNVYWYDSLDRINDKYKDCGSLGCEGSSCKTTPPPPSCTVNKKVCGSNPRYIYKYDINCNLVQDTDCMVVMPMSVCTTYADGVRCGSGISDYKKYCADKTASGIASGGVASNKEYGYLKCNGEKDAVIGYVCDSLTGLTTSKTTTECPSGSECQVSDGFIACVELPKERYYKCELGNVYDTADGEELSEPAVPCEFGCEEGKTWSLDTSEVLCLEDPNPPPPQCEESYYCNGNIIMYQSTDCSETTFVDCASLAATCEEATSMLAAQCKPSGGGGGSDCEGVEPGTPTCDGNTIGSYNLDCVFKEKIDCETKGKVCKEGYCEDPPDKYFWLWVSLAGLAVVGGFAYLMKKLLKK